MAKRWFGARRGSADPGGAPASAGAGIGDWLASLRFSGFTVLLVSLVVLGALIVSPTLATYVQQQRQLAELRASVAQGREAVADADAARLKWQDPAYVRAQARGRLFYVMPGETQLSVIADVVLPAESDEQTSDALTRMEQNWARTLLVSVMVSGTTDASPEELGGAGAEDDPAATADPEPTTEESAE